MANIERIHAINVANAYRSKYGKVSLEQWEKTCKPYKTYFEKKREGVNYDT